MATIGFVTTRDLSRFFPSLSEPLMAHDDAAAARFLREHGHDVVPLPWGEQEPTGIDIAIVRSPWDYSDTPDAAARLFAWLEELRAPLWNPLPLLRWNLDKHYLADLARHDVSVVPTEFIEPHDPLDEEWLAEQCAARGPLVLKPCISAGARDTFLIREPGDASQLTGAYATLDRPIADWRGDRSYLLQPFLSDIAERGEWSLVFIDGEYTHAVRKRPKRGGWWVQDELGGSVQSAAPPANVLDAACHASEQIVPAFGEAAASPLYGRVDIIEQGDEALVGEIELFEPELFFKLREPHDGPCLPALERFLAGTRRDRSRTFDWPTRRSRWIG